MIHRAITTNPIKAKLIFAFAIGFLALQLIVPTILLSAPRPARFGWQMYSGTDKAPTFWVVSSDGIATEVVLADVVGYVRLDIDYRAKIPRHLCDANPDATLIRFQAADSSSVEEFPCR